MNKNNIKSKPEGDRPNPFKKLIEDKERIADAVQKKVALSSLKGIKFVRPL